MQIEGLGDRPVVDSGGFPVVWIGDASCPIGQDPSQGGTNCYGPGDVLSDADTGAQYQIGNDWHVYPMGSQPSSSPAPSAPAPTLTDHFYYVDSGEIIEKSTFSDGTATFNDTGLQSPLGDGATAGNPSDLQRTTPQAGNPGGFNTPNPVGGFGPYASPDPPILTDLGTYVQNGELFDHQVDQFGNDYYQDLGRAPASPAPSPPVNHFPAPSVPTPRAAPPAVNSGAPVVHPLLAPALTPRPGSSPSVSGPIAPTSTSRPAGGTPAITATGDPTKFGHQIVTWLSTDSFIGGVPNGLLAAGGVVAFSMLRQRRRFL